MDFKEWFKSVNWIHVLILVLIFITAFGIRAMILRYDLMFEFDSYWHARMNSEWIDTGIKPQYDTIGTYHLADKPLIETPYSYVLWGTGVLAYKLFYLGAPYNQENWIFLVRLLPALYGALTALAAYLLFKWAFDSKKIGYIAGFVVGVLPGYIYRTMAGFYEEDAYGFLWMVLGFAFLVKAIKEPELTKEKIIYASLSGIMFGIMAFTWKVFVIVPLLIEAWFVILLIWSLIQKVDKKTIYAICGLFAICFVITAVAGSLAQTNWFSYQLNYGAGALGIEDNSVNTQEFGFFTSKGVGEENTGHQFFGTKYGVFNVFFVLGIIAIIYSLWKKKYENVSILFFLWGLMTFYLAWNKLKATYWYGLGLGILTAFTIATLIKYFEENNVKESWKVGSVLVFVFLLLGGTASGVIFTQNNAPNIITEAGWKDAVLWMQNNMPEKSNVFNWWSWGHWITFIGHQRASTDNTNSDSQANRDFGTFFTTENPNDALGIIKAYDTDYVVLSDEALMGQQTYATYSYNKEGDPRLKDFMNIVFPCYPEKNPITNTVIYNCGGNKLEATQMYSLPVKYNTKPMEIYQGKVPLFYYSNPQKNMFAVLNARSNNSFGAKLWFEDTSTEKYFTKVYDNSYVKIWKVNKEAYKDIIPQMTDMNLEQINEWNSKLWWLNDTNK